MDLSPTQLQFLGRLKPPEGAWHPKNEVKVVLITLPSPWLISDRDMPNLGVLYVASYLREQGINVQVVDFCGVPTNYWYVPEGDIYGISTTTPQYPLAKLVAGKIRTRQPDAYIVMGGYHPSALPDFTLEDSGCDCVVVGDGEFAMLDIAKGLRTPIVNGQRVEVLDNLPWPARDTISIRDYHRVGTNAVIDKDNPTPVPIKEEYVLQSRGCPFTSLAGDTLVSTVYGNIMIKELAAKYETVGVFSYDPETKTGKVTTACNIMRTGRNKKLVRIHFEGGSHVDCTPDHRFMAFKWGNQFVEESEWESRADELKPGDRLRSIREELSGPNYENYKSQYVQVSWKRRGREKKHRMIAEWILGRPLEKGEDVHHKDGNRLNNVPENLEVISGRRAHMREHWEVSERMRTNNPMFDKMAVQRAAETRAALAAGTITIVPSKVRYTAKGPARKRGSQNKYRIVKIEELPGLHDVYDMSVPETEWFYANDVLTHNCGYCAQMLVSGRRVRYRSPDCVREEMTFLIERYQINRFYLFDDIFIVDKRRVEAFCDMVDSMWDDGYRFDWHCLARADVGSYELYQRMSNSHCKQITYGLEHADDRILKHNLKECTAEQNMTAVVNAKKAGLRVRAQFIVGLPGETDESVETLAKFIQKCPADSMAGHCFVPLPGSPIYTHPEKFGWDWRRDTDLVHYQTIGKPGEWKAHQIHLNSDDVLRWLVYIKSVIAGKNVFLHDARHGAVIAPEIANVPVPSC